MDKPEMSEGITEDEFFYEDAASFQTARLSISSSLSSFSESDLPSLTHTPLDGRAIGRDIEERPSFSYLPFTYEEFYGQPHPTGRCHLRTCNCSTTRVELRAPATDLRADNVAARTGDVSSPPAQSPKMRIVYKIDIHTEGRVKTAMKIAIKAKGVISCSIDPCDNTMTITGVDIDVLHLARALRKKLLTDILSIERMEQQSQQ